MARTIIIIPVTLQQARRNIQRPASPRTHHPCSEPQPTLKPRVSPNRIRPQAKTPRTHTAQGGMCLLLQPWDQLLWALLDPCPRLLPVATHPLLLPWVQAPMGMCLQQPELDCRKATMAQIITIQSTATSPPPMQPTQENMSPLPLRWVVYP